MAQEKISVYNLADLKNTSDDAIPNYLNSLGFVQSHYLTDVHLTLGYGAFVVAGACFFWDWKLGFDSTKYYSAAAVLVYMALNAALSLWVRYAEKTTVYVGQAPQSGAVITIATAADKYTPLYNVTVTTQSKGAQPQTAQFSRAFSEWFDGAGRFVALPFQIMLASEVAAIGHADPKRAQLPVPTAAATVTAGNTTYDAEVLQLLAAANDAEATSQIPANSAAVATGSSTNKKGGKRRKA